MWDLSKLTGTSPMVTASRKVHVLSVVQSSPCVLGVCPGGGLYKQVYWVGVHDLYSLLVHP